MATDPLAEAQPDSLEHSVLSRADADADNRHAGIEFRDVRYFAAVAEELHFGRAAARLYISQPGLSQAIARLERELGAQLFTRTRSNVELTEAGTELLDRARGLLAGLDDAVTRVRMVGRGVAGLVRVGVALLAEPVVAPALKAFQEEHEAIVVDRSAMVSEQLLAQLAEGRLHAAVVHQIPALATVEAVEWEPLRRGRLAVLASPGSKLALREAVSLSELSDQTLLVNPRSLAPGAFEGLKVMCREFGGFDPIVLESAAASTAALDTDWRPIQDGTAVVVMAEATARAVRPAHVAVVPIQPPPQYVLALAWRRGERAAAAHRFLSCLRSYRDRHAWTTDPEPARDQNQPAGLFVNGNHKLHGANQDSPDAADADTALSPALRGIPLRVTERSGSGRQPKVPFEGGSQRRRRGARWCCAVGDASSRAGAGVHQCAWRQRSTPSLSATASMAVEQRDRATPTSHRYCSASACGCSAPGRRVCAASRPSTVKVLSSSRMR